MKNTLKVAWIRDDSFPVGEPATGQLQCPCGDAPFSPRTRESGDVQCHCGRVYSYDGVLKSEAPPESPAPEPEPVQDSQNVFPGGRWTSKPMGQSVTDHHSRDVHGGPRTIDDSGDWYGKFRHTPLLNKLTPLERIARGAATADDLRLLEAMQAK